MSVNNMIARGFNPGAGAVQGARNAYAIKQDQRANAVQDRSFNATQDYRNATLDRQATADQMAFGQQTLKILSSLPPEQRQQAYMARVQEAASTIGLPEGFNPEKGWANIQSQIPPMPVDPRVAANEEYDRRQAGSNAEWDRRNQIQTDAAAAEAAAKRKQAQADAAAKSRPSPTEVAQTESDASQFKDMITSADFSKAVGPWDDISAGFFGLFDTKDYRTNKKVTLAANELILAAAKNLKGALSDKDIKFLQDSQPKPSDHESVWRDWYNMRYLPRINAAREEMGLAAIPEITDDDYGKQVAALVDKYAK